MKKNQINKNRIKKKISSMSKVSNDNNLMKNEETYLEFKDNCIDILENNAGITDIIIPTQIIIENLPNKLCGVISPNPIVVRVTNIKYITS
jgi:hypothetical protein